MPGHKLLGRSAERLCAHEPALAGERIEAQYKHGAQVIRQRQAAFEVGAGRALVFTAATPRGFDTHFEAMWRAWLDSFAPAPPPSPSSLAA